MYAGSMASVDDLGVQFQVFGGKRKSFELTPAGLWTPKQQKLVTANYSKAYLQTPEHLLEHGASFYPHWNEDAQHLGEAVGQGTDAGATILASLSPSKEAEENRLAAFQSVHGVSDKSAALLMQAGEHAAAAKSAKSTMNQLVKRGEAGSTFHVQLMDTYEEHSAANRELREKAGLVGTVLNNFDSRVIANALHVRQGDYQDPLATLGDVKIGDFGRLINDPHGYPRAPIDTHIHDAGVGRFDIPYIEERGISRSVGRYEHFQDSIEKARTGVSQSLGTDLEMGAFMGGIWYGHQQRKADLNPNSARARKSSETKLANLRSGPSAQWAPENYGLRPSLTKIAT